MEIKACPFCGNEEVNVDSFGNVFYVKCEGCNACGPDGKNEEEAITLWNAAPRKEDAVMKQNCGSCKYNLDGYCGAVPPYKSFKVHDRLCCTDWEEKEDMEKNCRSCKYLKLGTKIKNKWYCSKPTSDGYLCKSWAPYNPFNFEGIKECDSCQYTYWYDYDTYCGKPIGSLDYCCPGWEAKEPESAPLNPSNSSSLDVIGEIVTRTLFPSNVRQLIEEAAELIVACNKYIRATGNGQPTPITEDQALTMIGEELADVHVVGEVLRCQSGTVKLEFDLNEIDKLKRWKERLKED